METDGQTGGWTERHDEAE